MVDYSKWNSFQCSDSNNEYDDDDDDECCSHGSFEEEILSFCDPKFGHVQKPLTKQQQSQLNKHVNRLEKSLVQQGSKLIKKGILNNLSPDQTILCR